MKLYLIRHGESTANRDFLAAGWGEFPLTENGMEQARQVGERLRKLPPFDKIYVSDLLRTRQTFEQAFGPVEHTLSPLIREIRAAFVGQSITEMIEQHGSDYVKARREMNYGPYGGENADEITARVRQFRDQLEQESLERVAVVCHGGVIRTFMALTAGVPVSQYNVRVDNCSVTVLEYRDGLWRLLQFNHIPGLL